MDPFARLAPFIQEFVYARGWTELRAIQAEAIEAILDGDEHVLLTAGTAGGKTEAAFLPILTRLAEQPSSSVGVLYVAPMKALINDQFLRLTDLLREAELEAWAWHGDVPGSRKARLLARPGGILQITPESLESLLINKASSLGRLFGDLRFVVLDELHVFLDSERGQQVLCQLSRLERATGVTPRRVGLSATLGDPDQAARWLAAGTPRPVRVLNGDGRSGMRLRLALEHFAEPADEPPPLASGVPAATPGADFLDEAFPWEEDPAPPSGAAMGDGEPRADALSEFVYEATRGRKSLIFTNSRSDAEATISGLRSIAEARRTPDVYHVHHGSVSAALREFAETELRDSDAPTVTAATVTMELGIDIGRLERVVQLDAPFTVSSFLQRLGRSGRRGAPSELWFATRQRASASSAPIFELLPWTMLQAIAIVQLYLEDRFVEPALEPEKPFSLLYHQAMSTLAANGDLSPASLAGRVLTLPPFKRVTADEFRMLLAHLLEIGHLSRTEEGTLLIGLEGEKVVRDFHFYAVFPDPVEFSVQHESREVGTLSTAPGIGVRFALAGRTWETQDLDLRRQIVYVTRVKGRAPASWLGEGAGVVHDRVLDRMRRVLLEGTVYPYLLPAARERLQAARRLAAYARLGERAVVPVGGKSFAIFPWMGTTRFNTAARLAARAGHGIVSGSLSGRGPYYLTGRTSGELTALVDALRLTGENPPPAEALLGQDEAPQVGKFDPYVPHALLRVAYCADHLDVARTAAALRDWL
ncbi:MAG TPA: DEAD/DEAH box helicase [Deinococcales bacterium]|nr:DEAD/DEAH box helicase [Deinococcales bacterium]